MLVFMDAETYEQIELPADILGERRPFLQDGMTILIEYHDAEALQRATFAAKGHLQGGGDRTCGQGPDRGQQFQAAILDNGVKVMVPPLVGQDEDIVVNTETMEYYERA